MAHSIRTLSHCFICGHVHDELIIECRMGVSLDAVCEQMGRTPPWISGLLLRADGYNTCLFFTHIMLAVHLPMQLLLHSRNFPRMLLYRQK